jgi:esterase/lipase
LLKDILKRFLVIVVGISISAYIWHINRNIFGNTIDTCLILSTMVFLITYIPFEAYFSVRKIWYDRWSKLDVENVRREKIKIPIDKESKVGNHTQLIANIVQSSDKSRVKQKKAMIIINHGYSDTKETLEYIYLPLAIQGYVILAYDARGTGESKKVGRRNQLKKRIDDYQKIIQWIKQQNEFQTYKIISLGFSIGAIISLSASFDDHTIEKIIAISCISHYKENVMRFNPLVLLSYIIRGIPLFPDQATVRNLSPYLIFKKQKENLEAKNYEKLCERIYIIHAENDKVIKFRNFRENRSILNLPKKNQLVFKKGGHTMKKNELALVAGIIRFLED